ncbi:hypothetical protein A2V56_01885 [Candidatus Woesebacteria bacterium RBG_19FT_COMBO_42_9]|uniref:Glycosyltransferase 2-like domain-containing protein n=1 Tax=Candidatus Woesebacteria bacterium RBG_16_42_24 TaxID=1802485 RepID=A0A1F7XKW5_9BACT|nr:MAG: hypothetical protein A2V97_02670 [Candidatus Woesebacteria bacterium RBG_16_42_24]OGM17066.1 MAG: hypothetical protein A2V56_01885 [Candidatus Woesebacteria bacterium RBG_19FT_COMBO_42_9]OGM66910.1 MAG: hypothetical protein A2985_01885 [Candidatus Woesebacteria bacterium RIFCSPLOWO2_01_FULL_43_11]
MKNANPLVSVIMPVYNAEAFVAEAVESILSQTYPNIEIILVDDASKDGTLEILKKYKEENPDKITLVALRKNRGKGGDAAANIAFEKANGEFIARMDADDIALPDRIEKQFKFLSDNPEYAVVGSCAHVINTEGEVVGQKIMPETQSDIYRNCFVFHPMINPTQVFRKSAFPGLKLYLNDNPTNNDYLTTMKKISGGARYYNLPEKLLYYRIHDKNDSLRRVRGTFGNSVTTRLRGVYEFGYKPSIFSIAKFLLQIAVVYLLPERVVFTLYMLIRGIVKPSMVLPSINFPVIAKLRKAFSS